MLIFFSSFFAEAGNATDLITLVENELKLDKVNIERWEFNHINNRGDIIGSFGFALNPHERTLFVIFFKEGTLEGVFNLGVFHDVQAISINDTRDIAFKVSVGKDLYQSFLLRYDSKAMSYRKNTDGLYMPEQLGKPGDVISVLNLKFAAGYTQLKKEEKKAERSPDSSQEKTIVRRGYVRDIISMKQKIYAFPYAESQFFDSEIIDCNEFGYCCGISQGVNEGKYKFANTAFYMESDSVYPLLYGIKATPVAINNKSGICGTWLDESSGKTYGFLWSKYKEHWHDLLPGTPCTPVDINNNGIVIGYTNDNKPFVLKEGVQLSIEKIIDSSISQGDISFKCINDNNEVILMLKKGEKMVSFKVKLKV